MRTPIFQICLLLCMLLLVGCGGSTAAPLPPTAATLVQPTAPLSVYIGRAAGTVSALNAADGTVRWRTQVAQASTPTVVALDKGTMPAPTTRGAPHPGWLGMRSVPAMALSSGTRCSLARAWWK
jgi:hypothetical protein